MLAGSRHALLPHTTWAISDGEITRHGVTYSSNSTVPCAVRLWVYLRRFPVRDLLWEMSTEYKTPRCLSHSAPSVQR
ncbi:hypothetical protein RRG08_020405 [Elysia crispata]|uniref:Uncharacterized protein n=1 Tax=Elysia crispata TaxID=231223 RepID=A0AAE1B4V6_9GAST|nr:hypothetical protein RRG08_020405 [Elysia crispata]